VKISVIGTLKKFGSCTLMIEGFSEATAMARLREREREREKQPDTTSLENDTGRK
jgi:hypothetical protein